MYSITTVSELLGVSPSTVRRMTERAALTPPIVGKRVIYRDEDITDLRNWYARHGRDRPATTQNRAQSGVAT